MSARRARESEVAVIRPAQPRDPARAAAKAERRLPGAMEVPIEQVCADPAQPRRDWEHDGGARRLDELIESIREFGVLQPLVVCEDGTIGDGRQRYMIIAGGRRYAAARRAGLATVPVVARSEESSRVRFLQLVENLQRQNLSPIDEARAYQELIDLENLSPPALAARLHLSAQHVRDRLRVLGDQVLADAVERRQISATAARDIMQLPDGEYTALRARVLNGEAVQSSDVATARGRLSAAGVANPRRKAAVPKKQTTFVPVRADTSAPGIPDSALAATRVGVSDEDRDSGTAAAPYVRNVEEAGFCSVSDDPTSSADGVARLIESALRDARRADLIAKITSRDDRDAIEEWWILVYRHLRGRLLTT